MIREVDKYKAQFFQVLGFSFMTPFAKLIMDIFDMQFTKVRPTFFVLMSISLVLVFLGIILVTKGMEHLEER